MTDKRDGGTPRTDAAWAECKRQGGEHEPFHSPLLEESAKLERELAAERERGARERAAGFEEAKEAARAALGTGSDGHQQGALEAAALRIAALRQEGK